MKMNEDFISGKPSFATYYYKVPAGFSWTQEDYSSGQRLPPSCCFSSTFNFSKALIMKEGDNTSVKKAK